MKSAFIAEEVNISNRVSRRRGVFLRRPFCKIKAGTRKQYGNNTAQAIKEAVMNMDWDDAGTYFVGLVIITFLLCLFKCGGISVVYWIIYFAALKKAGKKQVNVEAYRRYKEQETPFQWRARKAYGSFWDADFFDNMLCYDVNNITEELIEELKRTERTRLDAFWKRKGGIR